MSRPSYLIWLVAFLLILLPSTAGRVLVDIAGGLMLVLLAVPLILGGAGWIGWKLIQSRLKTCNNCGMSTLNNSPKCPACGAFLYDESDEKNNREEAYSSDTASSATIDINAEEAD